MSDMRALTDAFTELEQRADAASVNRPFPLPPVARPQRRPSSWLVPVGVATAVVAAAATGVALFAHQNATDVQAGDAPRGEPATTPSGAPPKTTTPPPPGIPNTADELAKRFRLILGDTATFTVTDHGANMKPPAHGDPSGKPEMVGAGISGTLTAAGVTGGYDLDIDPGDPGGKAMCDETPIGVKHNCSLDTLPDGSSVAIQKEGLANSSTGMTYLVELVRPNGLGLIMHVSNERSPKGASPVLAPQPPLTTDQMLTILTSDRWEHP